MEAPERIWIAPVHGATRPDDFYLIDPEYRNGRGVEYIRADLHRAEVDALVAAKDAKIARLTEALTLLVRADNLREAYHILPNDRQRIGEKRGPKSRARDAWLRAFRKAARTARAALRAHTEAAVSAARADCVRLLDEAAREYNRKTNDLIARHADQIDALRDREEAAVRRALEGAAKLVQSCAWGEYWNLDGEHIEPAHLAESIRALDPAQFIGGNND